MCKVNTTAWTWTNTSARTSSACRKHTAPSPGNKAEVYWCCCRITFEIASLFRFPCWFVGGAAQMLDARMQRCLADGRVACFLFFYSSPALWAQRRSAVSLLIAAGAAKKPIFSFCPCLKSNPDITVLFDIIHQSVCVCVRARVCVRSSNKE